MNIKKEYLGGGIYVFCSDTHRFGTDAVLLEAFAMQTNAKQPIKPKSIIDLGCGCGIIPMLFARDTKDTAAKITALDIQSEAAELTQKAVDYNKLGERVRVINADLNDIA
ncbi:MAG: methyltransferase, partial [Acutalibacteraceae bacterium]|nr:methyltransferase [Acutalibacteraceae bacterium]